MPRIRHKSDRQRGAALFILLLLILAGAFTLFSGGLNHTQQQTENDQKTMAALAQAKEALIGYATTYHDKHPNEVFGYLPCPADPMTLSEGSAMGNCGGQNVSAIGRLPWKTLGLPPLRDGYGECLWYAVSGTFENNPKTDLMNWDSNGLFEVVAADGVTMLAGSQPTNRAVAVIFSAGPATSTQNRAPTSNNTSICGGNYTSSNYLDFDSANNLNNSVVSTVANALTRFITAPFSASTSNNTGVNDKLVFITPDEIFAKRVEIRNDFFPYLINPPPSSGLLYKVATCIAATSPLPWAAQVQQGNYDTSSSYISTPLTYAGRVPYNIISACSPPINDSNNEWWKNWKDNLFYVISAPFTSGGSGNCNPPGSCVRVNSTDRAAILIFSGKKASGQIRDTNTDKGIAANYLEGGNLNSFMQNTGTGAFASGAPSNDTIVCINTNLIVTSC